jgi:hypothetical protein
MGLTGAVNVKPPSTRVFASGPELALLRPIVLDDEINSESAER